MENTKSITLFEIQKNYLRGAKEQLENVRAKTKVDQFQETRYSEIEQEKFNLVNSTYKTLEQLIRKLQK